MDHFDASSLRLIDRRVTVLIPRDEVMLGALKALGFRSIFVLQPGKSIEVHGLRVSGTPSLAGNQECGFLIQDDQINIWNQVDSVVSSEIVRWINREFGELDLALVRWQPIQDLLPSMGGHLGFPYSAYISQLESIGMLKVKRVVLGACGYRYCGRYRHLNHVVFPQSRVRALNDIRVLRGWPKSSAHAADPGDVVSLYRNGMHIARNSSPYVSRTSEWNDAEFTFSPWHLYGGCKERRHTNQSRIARETIERIISWAATRHRALSRFRFWRVKYSLTILGAKHCESFSIDFRTKPPTVIRGYAADASISCLIDESALKQLASMQTTWDRVILGGDIFHWHRVYRVTRRSIRLPQDIDLTNPLFEAYK